MAEVNREIADALTEQQIRDARVEAGLRQDVWAILLLLEAEIIAALKREDPTEFVLLSRRRREVEALMAAEIDPVIETRYARINALLTAALVRLAQHEAATVQQVVNAATGEATIEALPPAGQIRRVVTETLIPTPQRPTDLSATGETWWQRQGASLQQRIGDSLLVGVSLAETLTELAQRVKGTSDQGFQDGIMAKARDDAARLVRTQVTNAISEARVAVADRNAEAGLIAIHSSILDSRTSTICLSRHGLQYTIPAHEPINHSIPYLTGPPYHPNCRSSMLIGVRGGGPVMQESLTVWLQRRGPTFQDALLGPTRAQMFRAHRLTPRQLVEASTGRPLTLEELGA